MTYWSDAFFICRFVHHLTWLSCRQNIFDIWEQVVRPFPLQIKTLFKSDLNFKNFKKGMKNIITVRFDNYIAFKFAKINHEFNQLLINWNSMKMQFFRNEKIIENFLINSWNNKNHWIMYRLKCRMTCCITFFDDRTKNRYKISDWLYCYSQASNVGFKRLLC